MSKIVFCCIPAQGHINPTLGVVRELIRRGHEVYYYCFSPMREKIEATGATFISCDSCDVERKLPPKDAARIGKDMAFSTKILVDTTLALDDKVCTEMAALAPDCIVADSMAAWGKAAALKLNIPFVSSTTTFAFNRYSAKIMKQSLGDLFKMLIALPAMNKDVKRLQAKGYPVKSVLDLIQSDENTDTVVYTSPQFQPCADTFSSKYAFVGPSIRPATTEIEKNKPTLIYISMGTVNNDMMSLYKRCIEAFAGTDYEVIMSVGSMVDIADFGDVPENIKLYPFIDQIAVLQKADAFITHCGMNSATEGLYYCVPLVMLPQTSEQGGVCERVRELGAGVKLSHTDSADILNAVNLVLNDKTYKENAAIISDGFKNCTGAKGAADKIIQVCGGK